RPRPALTSVVAAVTAWKVPYFMPMLSNQRAVPGILPPPKNLLRPCAASVSPSTTRRISNPTSYGVIRANLDHRLQRGVQQSQIRVDVGHGRLCRVNADR